MTEPKSYPCATMVDICRIPEDRLSDFLAELPHVIPHIRTTIELQEACYQAAGHEYTDDDLQRVIAGGKWIDDDKGNIDVHIHAHPGDETTTPATVHIHENHKTGAFGISTPGGAA